MATRMSSSTRTARASGLRHQRIGHYSLVAVCGRLGRLVCSYPDSTRLGARLSNGLRGGRNRLPDRTICITQDSGYVKSLLYFNRTDRYLSSFGTLYLHRATQNI